jgi:alkylation response protein AidB-like acyl-CoA dehydrogenase
VDFSYSDDEQGLRDLFARFFARAAPLSVARAAEPSGWNRELWDKLRQLDVPGLAHDADDKPAPVQQLAIIAEQAGYHLAPVPVVETFVALRRLAGFALTGGTADPGAIQLLGSARHGEIVLSIALSDFGDHPEQIVPAGAVADYVVGLAGDAVVLLDRRLDLVRLYRGVHGAAPIAAWRWAGVAGRPGWADSGGGRGHWRAVDEWRVLTAAALNGLARHALEIGAAYATERRAFGTPIGTFQGVAHPLAEHATALSGSELLTRKAAWALDQPLRPGSQQAVDPAITGPDAHQLAAMAWAFAAETSSRLTATAVHVHGGYGAALEYDIQLFHTRAKAWANVAGSPSRAYLDIGRAQRRLAPRSA